MYLLQLYCNYLLNLDSLESVILMYKHAAITYK